MNPPGRIQTERLDLTPLRQDDAASMFAVLSDRNLYEFTSESPPDSIAALSATYAVRETGRSPDGTEAWLNWIVRLRKSGRAIGYVQASVRESRANVAWVIGVGWQGVGYATEASRAMLGWLSEEGVGEVEAHIHPAHAASQAVARKLRMERSGRLDGREEIWTRPDSQ